MFHLEYMEFLVVLSLLLQLILMVTIRRYHTLPVPITPTTTDMSLLHLYVEMDLPNLVRTTNMPISLQ